MPLDKVPIAPPGAPTELRTERLLLRRWRSEDWEPFAALNADARVMEHFPALQTREESDASADRGVAHFEKYGYGLWAVEVPGVTPFAGFIGLVVPRYEAHFTPCVEVGWRLAFDHWGRGYATEGARAAVAFAFDVLGLPEIVSTTAIQNARSRHVMEKLGMAYDPADDFDHPLIPPGGRVSRHVVYRLARPVRMSAGGRLA